MPYIPLQRLNLNMEIHCRVGLSPYLFPRGLLYLWAGCSWAMDPDSSDLTCLFFDSYCDCIVGACSTTLNRSSPSHLATRLDNHRVKYSQLHNNLGNRVTLPLDSGKHSRASPPPPSLLGPSQGSYLLVLIKKRVRLARWIDAYSILACVGLVASNIHLASLPPSTVKTDVSLRRKEVLDSMAAIRSTVPLSPYTLQGVRVVELLLVEETLALPGAEFDAVRHRKIVDDAAKASLACSMDETQQMKRLADDLEYFAQQGTARPPPLPAADKMVDALAGFLTSDTFRSNNSSTHSLQISTPPIEYDDDFYRSLGFLPPPAVAAGSGREIADLFAASYGGEEAVMQDW